LTREDIMANIIAVIALILFLAGILVFINKVLKIPSGKITGCCGGGGELSRKDKTPKTPEDSPP
jgi:hypothetical protein